MRIIGTVWKPQVILLYEDNRYCLIIGTVWKPQVMLLYEDNRYYLETSGNVIICG
jgi:hypothetical protein